MEEEKGHFRRNWKFYAGVGAGLAIAGISVVVMRGRMPMVGNAALDEGLVLNKLFVRPLSFLSKQTNNIVTVFERDGRGHPGYIVRCLETNTIFPSQRKAAEAFQIPTSVISDHLRGKFENAGGFHFERLAA